MKFLFSSLLVILTLSTIWAQADDVILPLDTRNARQGRLYFYWGWNFSEYTRSDILFEGNDYAFVLSDVKAFDRQSDFELDVYLNPGTITIPQYNFRIGYYINDHYDISFGIDHMKYVMQANQVVKISGNIATGDSTYDGGYNNEYIKLSPDFLKFEHTDGLNYVNFAIRRTDNLYMYKFIKVNLTEGIGAGFLLPKTNTTLLNFERYDDFHLSGFGLDAAVGLNLMFWDIFFVQSELKGGYINMPSIRTTALETDKASQDFWFAQINIVFGASIDLAKKDKPKK